ncbi:MAG: HlyD family type I secretion periplasmic adaptor subunit [Hyphomicrobiaceae bacterium]|nr:HlyD family type I secretion periplasmic adaptor subunit [Hyphomicrobiaceae bacterium]
MSEATTQTNPPLFETPEMRVAATEQKALRAIGKLVTFGMVMSLVFTVVILGWAALAHIAGAVIGQGYLVVEGNTKKIQHPDGGIIAAINVKNGDVVKAGDVLVRLDDTNTRAELGVITNQLHSLYVRRARLEAERLGRSDLNFDNLTASAKNDPALKDTIVGEKLLFEARLRTRTGEVAQLRERVTQIRDEIHGLEAQRVSADEQIKVTKEELADVEKLWKQGLTNVTRLNTLRRSITGMEGQLGEISAQIARAKGRITETELQITQIDKTFSTEIAKDFREAQDRIGDLEERRAAAEAKLSRVELRAPMEGAVHQLAFNTTRGVIAPGEAIMQIVPNNERLIVEARIDPNFVDQVRVGQQGVVRFPALDQKITPEVKADVTFISADLEVDQRQGFPFFRVQMVLGEGEIARLGGQRLMPGMPAEVHVQTGERTVLSYFLRPLTDQFNRAFRER